MPQVGAGPLSNRAINRAGDCLRSARMGATIPHAQIVAAWETLVSYRAEWSVWPHALTKVNMGLRSMARLATEGEGRVSQRLKRVERIIGKLARFPSMNLAQMQDIGGCRAVVSGLAELDRLRSRIRRNWGMDIVDEYDYVGCPKPSGYRAVHIVVRRESHLVEVQLRTRRQHRWAASVEFAEARNSTWLRDGDERGPLASAFKDLGEAFAQRDRGEPVAPELQVKLKHWLGALDEDG